MSGSRKNEAISLRFYIALPEQFLHLTAPTAAKAGHSVQCSNVTKELFKSRKTANMLDFYRSVGLLVGELSFFSLPFLSRLYC